MKRDRSTYDSVRARYDEFLEIQKSKPVLQRTLSPRRPFSPETGSDSDMSKNVFAAIGVGIGLLLLALAGYSLYVASRWGAAGLTGAATGYTIIAFFLILGGIGGIAATLNHNYRVLARPPRHR
jgi:hypothetical protein